MGSKNGPEKKLVKSWGWNYKWVPVGKLRRYWDIQNLFDAVKVPLGILKSIKIIRKFKPDVLFSKGGFVSVPVTIGAWMLRVPIVIHDSDSIPGLTTRLLARFSTKVCLGYKEASTRLKRHHKKLVVTGIPLRTEMFKGTKKNALEFTGLKKGKPIVLVMGGSLGAWQINKALERSLEQLLEHCQIIHLSGKGKALLASKAKQYEHHYKAYEYVHNELADLYKVADLIVSRAGANSLAEIQGLRKPSILIPLGLQASHGDQVKNAEVLKKKGACIVLPNETVTPKKLTKAILTLLKDEKKRKKMGDKAYNKLNPKAGEKIAELLLKVI